MLPGHDLDGTGGVTEAEVTSLSDKGVFSARFSEALFRDTLAFAELLSAGGAGISPRLVAAYGGERLWFEQRTSAQWLLLPRMGANLGQVLDNLLIMLDTHNEDETIFIGSRTPHLSPRTLQEAFSALSQRDVVVGPCGPRGVYLLGVRGRWPCGILGGVRWTEKHAVNDLLKAYRRARASVGLLEEFYPLQTPNDLQRLVDDLGIYPDRALSNLRRLLEELSAEVRMRKAE